MFIDKTTRDQCMFSRNSYREMMRSGERCHLTLTLNLKYSKRLIYFHYRAQGTGKVVDYNCLLVGSGNSY